jgi:hypothetical protein
VVSGLVLGAPALAASAPPPAVALTAALTPPIPAGPGASGAPDVAATPPAAPGEACGTGTGKTIAEAVGHAGSAIYTGEQYSSEVAADRRYVEDSVPLRDAIRAHDVPAVRRAVVALVFAPYHIVRLRIVGLHGVLSDIGGPYVLAPVGGPIVVDGRTVAHYVMSVQDDLGYVKLATRFIDVPVVIRDGHRQVMGTLDPGPRDIPALGRVHYRGLTYVAVSFAASAFPFGRLRISLFVPRAPVGLARRSCAAVQLAEWTRIAENLLPLLRGDGESWQSFVGATGPVVEAKLYVREGDVQLAGSTATGPATLPDRGMVTFQGMPYLVSSFAATTPAGEPPIRVYLLSSPTIASS